MILNTVAVQFHSTPQQIETLMFGDLEQNQIIRHTPQITPQQLQQLYNLETFPDDKCFNDRNRQF